jgi:hypothetical protein
MKHILMALVGIFLLAGCASTPPPSDPSGTYLNDKFQPAAQRRAFYILQDSHARDSQWLANEAPKYTVFICNPNMSATKLKTVRNAAASPEKGPIVMLAATSAWTVEIDAFNGAYWDSLESYFPQELLLRETNTRKIIRGWCNNDSTRCTSAYIMQPQSAAALAKFHAEITMTHSDYDGIYIDMLGVLDGLEDQPWLINRVNAQVDDRNGIDFDGDNVADSWETINKSLRSNGLLFTELLRKFSPEGTIIIGNAEDQPADPSLNGITLESVGDRFSVSEAMRLFYSQRRVSEKPYLSVAYDDHSFLDALRVAQTYRWVYIGRISTKPAPTDEITFQPTQ